MKICDKRENKGLNGLCGQAVATAGLTSRFFALLVCLNGLCGQAVATRESINMAYSDIQSQWPVRPSSRDGAFNAESEAMDFGLNGLCGRAVATPGQ